METLMLADPWAVARVLVETLSRVRRCGSLCIYAGVQLAAHQRTMQQQGNHLQALQALDAEDSCSCPGT